MGLNLFSENSTSTIQELFPENVGDSVVLRSDNINGGVDHVQGNGCENGK